MILSFHPCFQGDVDRLCAGRKPDADDLAAIQSAAAVILPQGCSRELHEMARRHCVHVFPDYRARFDYPGKIGQIRLFETFNAPHPQTQIFETCTAFDDWRRNHTLQDHFAFPLVFKFDWGGEGDTVFFAHTAEELAALLAKARTFEKAGQSGFLLQTFIPNDGKILRVVVVGETIRSYWRIASEPDTFTVNVARGAHIDHRADPHLQNDGINAVRWFCDQTGINLAGFDILFSNRSESPSPLFLEINYFFGRAGLGGSEPYYRLLVNEIRGWLKSLAAGY